MMKSSFLFSLCVHSAMICAFVALTQSTIPESQEKSYPPKVSVIGLNSFNAMVSKSPIVIDRLQLFHLEQGKKKHRKVDILNTFNESRDFDFDYPSAILDTIAWEESDTPFLDALNSRLDYFVAENNSTFAKISLSDVKLDTAENSFPASYYHLNHPEKEFFIMPSAILQNFGGKISVDNNLLQSENKTLPEISYDMRDMVDEAFEEIVNKDVRSHRLSSNSPIFTNALRQRFSNGSSLYHPKRPNDKDLSSSIREVFIELETDYKQVSPEILDQEFLHQGQLVQMTKEKSKKVSANNSEYEKEELKLWGVSIKNEIYSNLRYPHLAVVKKIGGKVTIQLKVTKDGKLKKLKLLKSSGFAILDEEALRATGQASNFPSAPVSLNHSSYSFSLPIKFEI